MNVVVGWVFHMKLPKWSEMNLNYWMIIERYPNLKDEVGGSILSCEIVSLLDIKTWFLPAILLAACPARP